jgi:hypothetical protein
MIETNGVILEMMQRCESETGFDAVRFAELIIREYEQFLPEVCPWVGANEDGPMKGWHVQFVARKHFGVEE